MKQIDRALERAPGKAQPSTIVKTELALNRIARDKGQLNAYRSFAAPRAQIHTEDSLKEAEAAFAEFKNRAEPSQFETKSVFMSCDGSLAVSQGRGRDPDGTVGNYVFVWERQKGIRTKDDEETGYRYVYFAAAADDPQPALKPVVAAPDPGGIVVEAIDSIRADIATCAPRDSIDLTALNPVPPPPGTAPDLRKARISRDATLHWVWTQSEQGALRVGVGLWRKDGWESVLTQDLPSAPN